MKKTNILFIMTDQMRYDAMGCTGGWIKTPNLDALANSGTLFTNCVSNSPLCVPARYSLATGWYPHNTGIWNNCVHDMPAETPTWMQSVRDAGYRTSLIGKTHLHRHHGDLRDREHLVRAYGIDDIDEVGGPQASARCRSNLTDRWERKGLWDSYKADVAARKSRPGIARPTPLPLEEYYDVYVGQQAKEYLANYKREEPWFCWVSFAGPHQPWDTPEPYASMYRLDQIPPPVNSRETIDPCQLNGRLREIFRQQTTNNLSREDIAALRANYAGNVTLIDDQIGEILATIRSRGEFESTLIVFCSDHGEMNGDHGLLKKGQFLNGAVRVPLIIRAPGTRENTNQNVCETMVELMDVGPTIVEWADGHQEYQHFARSLLPLTEYSRDSIRSFAVSEIDGEIMIMNQRWKLVFNRHGDPYLLFDQTNDPGETRNLVNNVEMSTEIDRMRKELFRYLIQTQLDRGAPPPDQPDPKKTSTIEKGLPD